MKPSLRQGRECSGFRDDLAPGNPTVLGVSPLHSCSHSCSISMSLCILNLFFSPCRIDFSPCTGEYATGNLYHVLMTHNKGKRATSLLPIVRTILGKTDLFYMGNEHTTGSIIEASRVRYFDWLLCCLPTSVAKDDKAYYQKKGKWHKCGCQRDHEWCQHLVST